MSHNEHARTSMTESSSPAPCYKCTRHDTRQNGRNLIVCIDGTSNHFGRHNTNVVKLFAKVNLETASPQQFAYYSSGIGTRPKSLHILDRVERAVSDKFDMAIAWNMEEIVKDAYGWLAQMYREGDRIYLFGFSRGAYQVRVLAGMIYEVGLLRTPTGKQIGTAYDRYEAIRPARPKTKQIAREFKNTFSWKNMRVHFVGVWDTVSSVGLIRGNVSVSTSSSAAHACHFRHALALDERRVKFMPEYFCEMNSQTDDRKSKYIVTSLDARNTPTPANGQGACTAGNSSTGLSGEERNQTAEIKEVWFAGSHADVGGMNRPGKSRQAGNVSMLWMRREAAKCGLVLWPTDTVWVPDDLDFGITDSMSLCWRIIEYMPIKHQISFSGNTGENARRWHRRQPRRIIPGQKVHASILYGNTYSPQATLGEGFDIPTIHTELEGIELDSLWETNFFDDTAAQGLMNCLDGKQGVAPIYLDRLLFMLQFEEGRKCVRCVPGWKDRLAGLINDSESTHFVKLATIIAYHDVLCEPKARPESSTPLPSEFPQKIFDDARNSFSDVYSAQGCPRMLTLLSPLAKHRILREHILSQDVLNTLVKFLSGRAESQTRESYFGEAIDGLNCLLRYEDTRQILIKLFAANRENSSEPTLSQILGINDLPLMMAVLRMMLTLARIPDMEARALCSRVKPRIRKLAKEGGPVVGLLAVEILLASYDPSEPDPQQLDVHDLRIKANIAGALIRLNPNNHGSTDRQGRSEDPTRDMLRCLFGLYPEAPANELDKKKKFLRELQEAVRKGSALEYNAATMTLLKLCENKTICDYLLEIKLLDVFIDQLQRKNRALLAAYALAVLLKHDNMKKLIRDSELFPKYIVGMLQLDYFDDAVGQVEGFQVFGCLMQDDALRGKIMNYANTITETLRTKLETGKAKEIRTSLICLDILRFFNRKNPSTHTLVDKSLEYLQSPVWKVQKAGVAILSALVRTEHGVETIGPQIHKIIEMLLPKDYQLSIDPRSLASLRSPFRPPSQLLGPACALRVLAQNKTLRDRVHQTPQYMHLKNLHLSEALVGEEDTPPWRIKTPNRNDVTHMLDKMIAAIDSGPPEEGLMSIGDAVLPHIEHWDRLVTLLRDRTVTAVAILPLFLGVSALAILAVIAVTPVYLSTRAFKSFGRLLSTHRSALVLDSLQGGFEGLEAHGERGAETDQAVHEDEGVLDEYGAGPSGEHHGGNPGVETVYAHRSAGASKIINATSQE